MQIKSKFWLEDDQGETVFGDGRLRILELIDELGSMQATSKALGMSYRGVWARIKATEERLGLKLVETSVGRGKNRGSRLTPEAAEFIQKFRLLNRKGIEYSDRLFASIFRGESPEGDLIPPIVAVTGPPGVGRTRLIADLIAAWAPLGRRVGVIEHVPPEEDTAADPEAAAVCFQAGAVTFVRSGARRFDVRLAPEDELALEAAAANFALGCDLVLVKTDRRINIPAIELFDRDRLKVPIIRKKKHLLAVVGDRPDKTDYPHVERNDVQGVIDLVENRLQGWSRPDVLQVRVDGKLVPMLPFVQDIIQNTLLGLITSLKNCQNAKQVEVSLLRRDTSV